MASNQPATRSRRQKRQEVSPFGNAVQRAVSDLALSAVKDPLSSVCPLFGDLSLPERKTDYASKVLEEQLATLVHSCPEFQVAEGRKAYIDEPRDVDGIKEGGNVRLTRLVAAHLAGFNTKVRKAFCGHPAVGIKWINALCSKTALEDKEGFAAAMERIKDREWFLDPRTGEPAGNEVFVMALAEGVIDTSILEAAGVGAPKRLKQDATLMISVELVASAMHRISNLLTDPRQKANKGVNMDDVVAAHVLMLRKAYSTWRGNNPDRSSLISLVDGSYKHYLTEGAVVKYNDMFAAEHGELTTDDVSQELLDALAAVSASRAGRRDSRPQQPADPDDMDDFNQDDQQGFESPDLGGGRGRSAGLGYSGGNGLHDLLDDSDDFDDSEPETDDEADARKQGFGSPFGGAGYVGYSEEDDD